MSDLEERLRAAVIRRSHDFEPPPDLPDRIVARVDHRRRVRRLVTGTAVTAAAAAVVVIVSLVGTLGRGEGSMWATDGGRPATSAHRQGSAPWTPDTTTTVGGSGPGTSTSDPAVPQGPGISPLTPLSRQGIGPITAGMTLRAAQDAAQTTITPSPGGSGDGCVEARIEGLDEMIVLVVEPSADPAGDPMDGIVRAVTGSVVATDEGAMVGQSRDELVAALGQPTATGDGSSSVYGSSAELLVFEAEGYAYGALVVDDLVLGLQSGDPAWVGDPDGCPG
jgi:hypothetical protein